MLNMRVWYMNSYLKQYSINKSLIEIIIAIMITLFSFFFNNISELLHKSCLTYRVQFLDYLKSKEIKHIGIFLQDYNNSYVKPFLCFNDCTLSWGLKHDSFAIDYEKVFQALREYQPFKITYRIITKSQKTKWVWEQGVGIFGDDGKLEFIEGFITDISEQKNIEKEKEELIEKLQKALDQINVLQGILPICASCKKIRDDANSWHQIEDYIRDRSEAEFSHGICPECA